MNCSTQIKGLIIFLSLFLVFSNNEIFCQPGSANFHTITPADGLPSTSIFSITQDTHGFIWIGTWEFAYRFDGVTFKKIPGSDWGRIVTSDNNGGVWISFSSSAGHFDSNTERITNYEISSPARYAKIEVDAVNTVWSTSNDGIVKLDTVSKRFEKDPGQRPGFVRDLKKPRGNGELLFIWEKNGSYLLGKRNSKGIYSYEDLPVDLNNLEKKGSRYGSNNFGFGVNLMDSSGILISNPFGLAYKKWDEAAWTYRKPLNDELRKRPSDLKLDNQGNLWFTQFNSLYKMNIETAETTIFKHDLSNPRTLLPMNSNRFLYFDSQGVLWIAHYGYGISRLNLFDSDFGLLKDSLNSPVLDVLSALELKDGSFWIGTRNQTDLTKGLIQYDSKLKIINYYGAKSIESPQGKTIGSELSHPYAHSLAITLDGSIWAGTGGIGANHGGLNRIRPGNSQITRFKNDPKDKATLTGDFVDNLAVDGSDRVWAFIDYTNNPGISVIEPVTEKITPKFQNLQSGSTYYFNLITSKGDVIVRTDSFNHFIIDHKTLEVKPFAEAIAGSKSMHIFHQDEKERTWFNTLNGFGYLNAACTETERFFDFEKLKFPGGVVRRSFCFDRQGLLWLAVGNGLIQFDPSTESFKQFGFERGLQGSIFRSVYKGPSGKLYFMGTGGVNIFDPEKIKTNPYPPQMVFTGLKLDEKSIIHGEESAIKKPIFISDKITVDPEINVISVDFAAMHFASSKNNSYQYKLQGFDKNWRDGGNIGNATYTNLAPGEYTLFIKGSNLDNVWSDGTKSITIIILPPWWRTWWAYILYAALFLFILWQIFRYQKKRTIRQERERTQQKELEQAKEIERAYTELKSTQAQLIQSEKMASLGELTAGIAHEIQNPLNFVNNFSEVNAELIEEATQENKKGNTHEVEIILKDIKENSDKINHHGNRAADIVKGMLQHSSIGTGKKEPTHINALADEYLRLAYHGLRAKDKSFNSSMIPIAIGTDFDESIGNINIIPQDIGRVILNLINNAFYAVNARLNESFGQEKSKQGIAHYEPTVEVSTKKEGNKILITVKDNGNGVPEKILDKIFQPFFTTKPTGQGTGLGLSLSYDIVKAHGGEIKVSTKENEGTEFTILLPIN